MFAVRITGYRRSMTEKDDTTTDEDLRAEEFDRATVRAVLAADDWTGWDDRGKSSTSARFGVVARTRTGAGTTSGEGP
ncbi:hypothetical protein GCM10029964_097390 [Kibdelosporangium lantanae]